MKEGDEATPGYLGEEDRCQDCKVVTMIETMRVVKSPRMPGNYFMRVCSECYHKREVAK